MTDRKRQTVGGYLREQDKAQAEAQLRVDIARSKPLFRFDDRAALQEVCEAALEVVFYADLIDGEWFGRLVSPDRMERLEAAIEKVQRT